MPERKSFLLRLDPEVHDALARRAADELRSTDAQIDYVLREALRAAGRLPEAARPARSRRRGARLVSTAARGRAAGRPRGRPRAGSS